MDETSTHSPADIDKIAKLLSNSGIQTKRIVLSALSCLNNAEIYAILDDLLIELGNRSILSPLTSSASSVMTQSPLQHFLLMIVRKFLADAEQSLSDIIDLFKTNAVSEYRLYLWLDAITARAVVRESLKDTIGAKNDILSILQNVFGISWDMYQTTAKVPPLKIPDSCSRLAALSVSRLTAYSRRFDSIFCVLFFIIYSVLVLVLDLVDRKRTLIESWNFLHTPPGFCALRLHCLSSRV